jgi:ABC-type glycerol-3-phosphate transport system substrate-binding protein
VRIEVRVKAVEGAGGLLDSLTTTSAAAPLALPNLIALPRHLLEPAAIKGLLQSYDDLSQTLDDPDWYEYARQLAQIQNSVYGIPFAGDAMLMVYRPEIIPTPPDDWTTVLDSGSPLIFPAADPEALFTIAQYQANGGEVRDDQGRPTLDADSLSDVLSFYSEAVQIEKIPLWVTQYQSDEQIWEAYLENRADIVISWATRYLAEDLEDSAVASIPTPDGKAYTLADGWVWALVTPPTGNQELSVELAEYLTEDSFLAAWSEAAGYLPTRPSALETWSNSFMVEIIDQIELSSHLYPSADVLTSLGLPLQQATTQVLKQQSDPLAAAQEAATSLIEP